LSRTSTNEQYQHGWLIIDKLPGLSSAKIVAIAKKALGAKKVGHAGTLDPLASGILPLAFGEATKTMRYVLTHDKEYIFTLRFGEQTDTDDLEGNVKKYTFRVRR
jgi:tRNA pseudouridine55 synthase